LVAPKGTPDNALKVLVNALEVTMKDPEIGAKLENVGLFARYENPAQARQRLMNEYQDVLEVDRQIKQAK
jgi:tripartite-type tricarboxylate transporter receptor subunit TctC